MIGGRHRGSEGTERECTEDRGQLENCLNRCLKLEEPAEAAGARELKAS
jgi:hypothetical protein